MAQVDYQAHNFTCYTVPECSSNDELEFQGENYGSQCSLNSTESTTSSIDNNILRKHHQQIKYYKKFFNPYVTATSTQQQRISLPLMMGSNSLNSAQLQTYQHYMNSPYQRQLQQQQQFQDQQQHCISAQSPQLGYFVPFAPNCYFSPPVQRKRYRDKENDRNRRAVSYGGITNSTSMSTLPRAAPRRVNLMKDPPPPPPPKPILLQQTSTSSTTTNNSIPSKYPQSEYNLITKLESTTSSLTAPTHYQAQNFYANVSTIAASSSNNYSSLLCHASSTSSPLAVRKREKLLHRFSDAATLGRKLKKKKNTNRTCRSMTEAIEMLADPVIEDEFFGDRTTWEYHTVSVTRVPGYGFGIAVSGGRDNPHFANGDPSIAVSDVLKGGPAEDRLQVNDRIISVNGVSLENVEYATAVQVLRDSGNTVTLVVKRRVPLNMNTVSNNQHQHSHSMSNVGLNSLPNTNGTAMVVNPTNPNTMSQPNSLNSSLIQHNGQPGQPPIKVTLTKNSKKDDYGIVLGCRLFIKEISSKARDQLAANGYSLQEGDVITRIHNTNCADTMSLKEAKKIIDGCKERLNLVVLRDITNQPATTIVNQLNNSNTQPQNIYATHQPQLSNCSNNLDDPYLNGGATYSSQNLYVQPPTRSSNNGPPNGLNDEKSNLTPRGRSRGPIMDGVSLQQLDRPVTPPNGSTSRSRIDEPPRPPPPRGPNNAEDFYSSRRQLYEDDPLTRSRQSAEPRFISFQKEGSVGIRLTGGNEAGIFVTAVQPGSPASLQGLTPGDKILKVNDMDMHGVTREEAVLFLLSLQDRIDLIVQYCKEEYDEVVNNQRGDSFHIKTHFHCDNPSKGEMAFKAGDVFRVIDTLHNGVVGSWQVLKIGRGHQEMQRGVIPNKARAEELATAQFNATKKEMNANESRGNFFRRRRSTHRRSKSLSRENWDDVVFSDSISKFPAYERVVLRHPGFVRPVVIFGPISDLAREKLAKDYPDKFSTPLQDDDKTTNAKCRIVRLSNIRDIMDRGKHALLDITPNAVDRLNYAQFYPIVLFCKTDSKHVIKQLRQGMPKAAHKSSKKLLEQCQKLERVWSHIFSTQIVLNDEESWYRKLRDAIDLQQSGAVWMSETKLPDSPTEMLFPPYIAQPCQLSCCRPMSSSVPRYAAASYNHNHHINNLHHNALMRRNSFTLMNNDDDDDADNDVDDCNDLIPPRPPELLVNNSNEMPKRLTSYEMIPIIKPASSMPNGLPNTQPLSQDMATSDEGLLSDGTESHYRGSQPNIMMTSFRSNSRGTNKTDNISNLTASTTLASSTLSNLTSKSGATGGGGGGNSVSGSAGGLGLSSYGNNSGSGPLGSSRYSSRAPSIEPRTTAYYYHELAQKSAVFDSNLNLLNDNKNDNTLPTTIADTVNVRQQQQQQQQRQHQPLPRQQLSSNSGGHKLSSFNGSLDNVLETTRKNLDDLILGNSLLYNAHSSNDLLNCNTNGNSSSAGTLVDENLNLSYSHHTNQNPIPAARNVLSSNSSGYLKRSSHNLSHHTSSNSNMLNSNNGNNNHINHSQSHHNEKYVA
ncbi:uncharacterized protein pyd isoform X11 [Calliphora vicina]|uniref:uncharacterized protein pyd isoform X11 n=1 Tax=Calliphora vicina TaxID=7373 RepID=UPI00325C0BE5